MFDFHMHSRVSFDGRDTGRNMALAARNGGLREICFTDHMDYDPLDAGHKLHFAMDAYNAEYDALEIPGLIIRRDLSSACCRRTGSSFSLTAI